MEKNSIYYDRIVKESMIKDLEIAASEDIKNLQQHKFWKATKEYQELKLTEKDLKLSIANNENKSCNDIYFVKSVENERKVLNDKLKRIESNIENLNEKCIEQMMLFTKNVAQLSQDFKDLDPSIDSISLKQEIENINQKQNKIRIRLEGLKINDVKAIIERHEINKIPGLKEIEQTMQKESFQVFGDPMQAQRRLLDVTKHIKSLKAKIKDIC